MAFFDGSYYLQAKIKQLAATGESYTVGTLKAAFDAAGLTPAEHYELYGSQRKAGYCAKFRNAGNADGNWVVVNPDGSADLIELHNSKVGELALTSNRASTNRLLSTKPRRAALQPLILEPWK